MMASFLFRYGHFSGINRKVQLTYLPHGQPKTSSEEEGKAEVCFTCCLKTVYVLCNLRLTLNRRASGFVF